MDPKFRPAATLVALLAWAALAGCSPADPAATGSTSEGATARSVTGPITVLAAASLTETFTTLGRQFEQEHPGSSVTFSFAGSSALAAQIAGGVPADVFAPASTATMDQVVRAGNAADPTVFATNSMEIAVPPDNPGRVDSLDDLADPKLKTAVCQPQVPCGATADVVFSDAGIAVTPVTLEPDVKAVLSKVRLNEVDAGMVYVTDVRAAGDEVLGVAVPADVNASTEYPIAVLAHSANARSAHAFVDYVLSASGQSVLAGAGFAQPGRPAPPPR